MEWNLMEWLAGTNPRNPEDYLSLQVRLIPDGYLSLRFLAQPGKEYVLECLNDSVGGLWQACAQIPGQAEMGWVELRALTALDTAWFYRLRLAPSAP